jgi:hypothetical protein
MKVDATLNRETHCINISVQLICKIHTQTYNVLRPNILHDTTARIEFILYEKTRCRLQPTKNKTDLKKYYWISTSLRPRIHYSVFIYFLQEYGIPLKEYIPYTRPFL